MYTLDLTVPPSFKDNFWFFTKENTIQTHKKKLHTFSATTIQYYRPQKKKPNNQSSNSNKSTNIRTLETEEDKLIGVTLPAEQQVGPVVHVDAQQHRGRGPQRAPRQRQAAQRRRDAAPQAGRQRAGRTVAGRDLTTFQAFLVDAALFFSVGENGSEL